LARPGHPPPAPRGRPPAEPRAPALPWPRPRCTAPAAWPLLAPGLAASPALPATLPARSAASAARLRPGAAAPPAGAPASALTLAAPPHLPAGPGSSALGRFGVPTLLVGLKPSARACCAAPRSASRAAHEAPSAAAVGLAPRRPPPAAAAAPLGAPAPERAARAAGGGDAPRSTGKSRLPRRMSSHCRRSASTRLVEDRATGVSPCGESPYHRLFNQACCADDDVSDTANSPRVHARTVQRHCSRNRAWHAMEAGSCTRSGRADLLSPPIGPARTGVGDAACTTTRRPQVRREPGNLMSNELDTPGTARTPGRGWQAGRRCARLPARPGRPAAARPCRARARRVARAARRRAPPRACRA